MTNYKKILSLLVLLLTAATGAWAQTPVTVTKSTTANTWSLTMPGGNVEVTPEYYPQAAFATGGAPVKIENVRATTDDAIVKAGTVKNIGESTTPQGTVMYYAVQSTTAPTAPGYDTEGWSEKVPTAANFNQGPVYVWYYIAGANGKTDEYIFSDGDITAIDGAFVTLLDAPTYAVSLNKNGLSEAEANAWKAKSTNSPEVQIGTSELNSVKKAETVTVTYTGQKKVLGVKAEKKAAEVKITSFSIQGSSSNVTFGNTFTCTVVNIQPAEATNQTFEWRFAGFETPDATIESISDDTKTVTVRVGSTAGPITIKATAKDGSGSNNTLQVFVQQ